MSKIHIVLPYREGFGPSHFGAVALCVRDFTQHSRYRDDITIFGGVDIEPFDDMPYEYLPVKKSLFSSGSKYYASTIIGRIKHRKPDLVEVHNRPNLVRYLRKEWSGNITLHLHNDPLTMRGAKTITEREALLQKCNLIYCVSEFIKDQFCEGLRGNRHKVRVVYNGFPLPEKPQMKKQKHILFIGRFQAEKGALELTEALENILPQHEEWKAIFIGASRHDPSSALSSYEQQVSDRLEALENRVEKRGYCRHRETLEALQEAAIVVVPSQCNEAFGRTALEAMAHGCAVLATTRGGLKEVIGTAAHPMKTASSQEIESGLEKLITDTEYREELQRRGIEQAKRFDIEKSTHTLDEMRRSLFV